jgi:hypothetical protein
MSRLEIHVQYLRYIITTEAMRVENPSQSRSFHSHKPKPNDLEEPVELLTTFVTVTTVCVGFG